MRCTGARLTVSRSYHPNGRGLELFKQRKQYAEDILALRKQRIEEANALFEPQKIGKNNVYFPSGTPASGPESVSFQRGARQ
jgi:hypothetical protein